MKFVEYENNENGIATITLKRPPANAFSRKMANELIFALESFGSWQDARLLILTGTGRFFSTGEDLGNIKLEADIPQMRKFAENALGQYHQIVRAILLIDKPIVALLNGAAVGAGMSIALACDRRFVATQSPNQILDTASVIFAPAFADMGLIPDSGMTATLPRLVGWRVAQKLCDTPGERIIVSNAIQLGLVEQLMTAGVSPISAIARMFDNVSSLSYALSKKMRNEALVYELNKRVFPWELRAQTNCLISDYFKERARSFFAKQKSRKEVM